MIDNPIMGKCWTTKGISSHFINYKNISLTPNYLKEKVNSIVGCRENIFLRPLAIAEEYISLFNTTADS